MGSYRRISFSIFSFTSRKTCNYFGLATLFFMIISITWELQTKIQGVNQLFRFDLNTARVNGRMNASFPPNQNQNFKGPNADLDNHLDIRINTTTSVQDVVSYQMKKIENQSEETDNQPSVDRRFAFEYLASNVTGIFVCRFHNSCMRRNGSLILPFSMKIHQRKLSSCQISSLEFFNSSGLPKFEMSAPSSFLDLLGAKATRFHMPHFLTDFMPGLIAYDMLNDRFSKKLESFCQINDISEGNSSTCGHDIFQANSDLRLAHIIHNRDMVGKFKAWIPQLLSSLSKTWYLYTERSLHSSFTEDILCFNSIIRFNGNARMIHSDEEFWYRKAHRLMQAAPSIPKSDKGAQHFPLSTLNRFKKRKWNIRFTILDRKEKSRRCIFNIGEVERMISELNVVNNWQIVPTLRVVYLEDMSFLEQVREMQLTDILIGVHGAGMTNLIFARPGTPILEIYPFLYVPPNFLLFARKFRLSYFSMIAQPDTTTFENCVRSAGRKHPEIVNASLEMWKMGKQIFGGNVTLDQMVNKKIPAPNSGHLRVCLRIQTLYVDVSMLHEKLKHAIQLFCKKHLYL